MKIIPAIIGTFALLTMVLAAYVAFISPYLSLKVINAIFVLVNGYVCFSCFRNIKEL